MDHGAQTERRDRRVTGCDGLDLSVQERGDPTDPTVVLVHGYPDDHAVWDLVGSRLADRHHVVTYDVRGAGTSDVPDRQDQYGLEALVADLAAVAEAVAGGEPVHLVGHDWGSIQGWAAVTEPSVADRFASFTSISGPSLEHAGRWVRRHGVPGGGRWRDGGRQALRSWYIAAMATPLAPWMWTSGPLAGRWPDHLANEEHALVDDRWPGPHLRSNGSNGVQLYRANLFGRRSAPASASTVVPVQVIVPAADRYVTPALLDGIEAVAPDLVRRDVDGGHWIIRSDPDLVAGLVADHIASVGSAR
ncbi:MAG: alpha/beta fold hydrolase [Aquihabitans sp.]